MKRIIQSAASFLAVLSLLSACSNESDDAVAFTGASTTTPLFAMNQSGLAGNVTFNELDNGSVQVVIEATAENLPSTIEASLFTLSGAENGEKVVSLNPISASGKSTTTVSEWSNQTALNYDDLLQFKGHLRLAATLGKKETLAVADLNELALTDSKASYLLSDVNDLGFSGTVTFYKRKNETTFAVLQLNPLTSNGLHPCHIHIGSIDMSEDVEIAMMLSPVNGNFGLGYTQISTFGAAQRPITYEEVISFDGHIKVHESMTDKQVLVTGNIGANAL